MPRREIMHPDEVLNDRQLERLHERARQAVEECAKHAGVATTDLSCRMEMFASSSFQDVELHVGNPTWGKGYVYMGTVPISTLGT
jgi:hypothetical protein